MKPGRATLLTLTALVMTATVAHAADTAARAFREAREYTVRVRAQIETPFIEDARGTAYGAGFLVDAKRGWIATNAHVVGQSPSNVEITFADGDYQPARKIYVDSFADIAVLAIEGIDPKHKVAKLSCGEAPDIGEPIGAFGHPLGIPFTGSRGIVSATTDQIGPDLIQIDATVDPGNSGGPVISMSDGRVIGIATSGVDAGGSDELNFATPSKDLCRILSILREGNLPTPPRMTFALLRDEDDRHTLEVAHTLDHKAWPFEPGDVILGLADDPAEIADLGDFVNAMRGRAGEVPLRIVRGDAEQTLFVSPVAHEPLIERQGIMIDGALIAPFSYDDQGSLSNPSPLRVHSVEPGSNAEMLSIWEYDFVESIDGREFNDLESLATYLQARPQDQPLTLVLRRWSEMGKRIFDYHVRELPGTDLALVGKSEQMSLVQDRQ